MKPATSERNLTPSSTAPGRSPSGGIDGVVPDRARAGRGRPTSTVTPGARRLEVAAVVDGSAPGSWRPGLLRASRCRSSSRAHPPDARWRRRRSRPRRRRPAPPPASVAVPLIVVGCRLDVGAGGGRRDLRGRRGRVGRGARRRRGPLQRGGLGAHVGEQVHRRLLHARIRRSTSPRSWLPSRPHDHWMVPAPNTSAPLGGAVQGQAVGRGAGP